MSENILLNLSGSSQSKAGENSSFKSSEAKTGPSLFDSLLSEAKTDSEKKTIDEGKNSDSDKTVKSEKNSVEKNSDEKPVIVDKNGEKEKDQESTDKVSKKLVDLVTKEVKNTTTQNSKLEKNKATFDTKEENEKLKSEVKDLKEEVKTESKEIKAALKEDNKSDKAELKSEVKDLKEEVKTESKETKAALKEEIKPEKSQIKSELKDALKEEIKPDITQIKSQKEEIKGEIKELKAALKEEIKAEKSQIKSELKDLKEEVKTESKELKAALKEDIKSDKAELIAEIKELKDEIKPEDKKTDIETKESTKKEEVSIKDQKTVFPEEAVLKNSETIEKKPFIDENKKETLNDILKSSLFSDIKTPENKEHFSSGDNDPKQNAKNSILTNMFLSSQRKLKEMTSKEQLHNATKNIEQNKSLESIEKSAKMLDLNPDDMEVETAEEKKEGSTKKDISLAEKNNTLKLFPSARGVLDRIFLEKQIEERTNIQSNKTAEEIISAKVAAPAQNKSLSESQSPKETVVTLNVPSSVVETIQNKIIGAQQKMGSFMSEVARNMYLNYKPPVTAFRMNLNPANLGNIAIVMKANKTDNSLSVSMNMSNGSTMEVFADNKTALQNALARNLNDGSNISLNFGMQNQNSDTSSGFNGQNSNNTNQDSRPAQNIDNTLEDEELKEEVSDGYIYS